MKQKITTLIVLAMAVALCLLAVCAPVAFADDESGSSPKICAVVAHGGVIDGATSEKSVRAGKVVEIKLDQTKWQGHTFECWRSDDGTTVPQQSFKTLVERDVAFYPVFSDFKGNYGEWTTYKKGELCVDFSILVRVDQQKGLKEFKYEQGRYDHDCDYEKSDEQYHVKHCNYCSYSAKEQHNWNDGKVTVEPTHGKEGVKTFLCYNCGATKTEPIEKTAEHSFPYSPKDSDYDIVKEAKDGKTGIRRLKCTEGDAFGPEKEYIAAELPKAAAGKTQHFMLKRTSPYGTNSGLNRARVEEHYIGDDAYYYAVKRDASSTGFALLWVDKGENSPVYVRSGKFNSDKTSFVPDSRYGSAESDYYGILCYVDNRQEFLDLIMHWSNIYEYDNGLSVSNFYYTISCGYRYFETLYNDGKFDKMELKNSDTVLEGWDKPLRAYDYNDGNRIHSLYVDDRNVCVRYAGGGETAQISYREVDAFPFAAPDRDKITHYSYYVGNGKYQGVYDDGGYFGMTSKDSSAENRTVYHNTVPTGKLFSHWEKYDPYTHKWEFCTDEESWTPSVTDVTTLRAVFKDKTVHIKVNGGYFVIEEGWEKWSVEKYNDVDVVYDTVINLRSDSKQTPEGKQVAGIVDADGNAVTERRIYCKADAEYSVIYEDKDIYVDVRAEHGVVKKDGEVFNGGRLVVGLQVTFTTESSDATAYPNFLGWCRTEWTPYGKSYTVVSTDTTYTMTISDNSRENDVTAVWSAETSLPVLVINTHDVTATNGLVRANYGGVATSCVRVADESMVWAIADPTNPRELSRWTLSDADGDGTALAVQEYDKNGNVFYISGGGKGGGKGKGGGEGASFPANIAITGYFKKYCVHTCAKCGCCTLPSTDTSCDAKRCECQDADNAPLIITNTGIVKSVVVAEVDGVNAQAYTVDLQNNVNPYIVNVLAATNDFNVQQLYDISLVDADGNRYQLTGGATATLTLNVGAEYAKAIADGKMFVAHVTEFGTDLYGVGHKPVTVNQEEGTVTLSASEFSPFALVSAKTFKATFDANGGSGVMNAQIVKQGESFTLPQNGFTAPTGKRFKGWSTSADGKIIDTPDFDLTKDTTFYAIWETVSGGGSDGNNGGGSTGGSTGDGSTGGTDNGNGNTTPKPPKKGLNGGAIAGIVIGSVVVIGLGGFAIVWFVVKKKTFADLAAAFKGGSKNK